MSEQTSSPIKRLITLVLGTFHPPPGNKRIMVAFIYGAVCHTIFGLAVLSMIVAMFFGMSMSLGPISAPWSVFANMALIIQFPVVHSLLLTRRGGGLLAKLAPIAYAKTLSTTTYAIVASAQLLALFVLWTPSGIVWWQAEGTAFVVICGLYAMSWMLLMWASFDAGAEVQSGALGWMSLAQNIRTVFPEMPTRGLFRVIRQPIYVAFALTTWTVPVWTPDQLALAVGLTSYCLLAPVLKERRFAQRYGAAFADYKRRVPYAIPSFKK